VTRILVAHAPAAKARAADVAEALSALGYQVEVRGGRALSPLPRGLLKTVSGAAQVVVLWSKEAAASPGLVATARQARANGNLALARLDRTATPAIFNGVIDLSGWMGAPRAPNWRRLVARLPAMKPKDTGRIAPSLREEAASPAPKQAGAGWIIGAVAGLVGAIGVVGYFLIFGTP